MPSPKIYENYLEFLEQNRGAKIEKFIFRDKNLNGWHHHVESYFFEQEKGAKKPNEKVVSYTYSDLFYTELTLRTSCESCKYASKNRPGDITMADCWGIEKIKPDLWNDDIGISVCLIQTKRGEELFKLAKEKLDTYKLDEKTYSQRNLEQPTATPKQTARFWKDYKKLDFEKLLQKYTIYGGEQYARRKKWMKRLKKCSY